MVVVASHQLLQMHVNNASTINEDTLTRCTQGQMARVHPGVPQIIGNYYKKERKFN